jgi:dihydrofolate reductase
MPSPFRVVGYAIVSSNGMIADAAGAMPPGIVNAADQRYFSDGLDAADVVVHGRNSHEHQPNSPRRHRLVLTHSIAATEPHPLYPLALLWNPAGASLEEACAALNVAQGTVAIIGGTGVFGRFLPRYDAFHLTQAPHASIPEGRPVFPGIPPQTPEDLLRQHGLQPGRVIGLDLEADISVHVWERLAS